MSVILALAGVVVAQSAPADPDFQEVYSLIRNHLPSVTAAELDRAAVQGIFSNLSDKVLFIPESDVAETNVLTRTNIFEGSVGYVRAGVIAQDLPTALRQTWVGMAATNRLKGLVVDLRYAGGHDYTAAAKAASLFLKGQEPLLDFGQGMIASDPVAERINVPVAVLVNAGTASAAEALAGLVRETGVGLLLGSKTAGKAMMYSEYRLKSGGAVRILRGPIRLGEGKEMESGGVTPDIAVDVAAAEERAFFADAFRVPTNAAGSASASASRRVRLNEAELARERRESGSPETVAPRVRRPEPDKPAVSDPVLARALDLLKGLAVVRQTQP